MTFFTICPPILPNETFWGYWWRIAYLCGESNIVGFNKLLTGKSYPDNYLLIDSFCKQINAPPSKKIPYLLRHTIFPALTLFDSTLQYPLDIPTVNKKVRISYSIDKKNMGFLFCTDCATEDLRRYGFSYWHREHELPCSYRCFKHDTLLTSGCGVCRFSGREKSIIRFPGIKCFCSASDLKPAISFSVDQSLTFHEATRRLAAIGEVLLKSRLTPDQFKFLPALYKRNSRHYFDLKYPNRLKNDLQASLGFDLYNLFQLKHESTFLSLLNGGSTNNHALHWIAIDLLWNTPTDLLNQISESSYGLKTASSKVLKDFSDAPISDREICSAYFRINPTHKRFDFKLHHNETFFRLLKQDGQWLRFNLPSSDPESLPLTHKGLTDSEICNLIQERYDQLIKLTVEPFIITQSFLLKSGVISFAKLPKYGFDKSRRLLVSLSDSHLSWAKRWLVWFAANNSHISFSGSALKYAIRKTNLRIEDIHEIIGSVLD